ncbi:hypothetical protein [Methanogenium sp. MK-MG]|uniref:hypothetical protein n=1 Tax=Methanogenium sp. MK-MG TaxID=2599926 RepID=UPI0013EDD4EF|nr:hypothetical protein [Methanogenium sp. MK-MG]KAF1078567.1 hypothetical protein MKMG_00527 [Methanogenium sp. MK-MG]
MARERFIKSDLDEGFGVEGKRPHDTKVSVDEESGSPIAPEGRPAPDEQDQNQKAKKGKSFDRLSIKEQNDANIFR